MGDVTLFLGEGHYIFVLALEFFWCQLNFICLCEEFVPLYPQIPHKPYCLYEMDGGIFEKHYKVDDLQNL